jgi:hypothetical protein
MSPGREREKPKAKNDRKKERPLSEAELGRVSGGATPINDKPRKAEPVSGATTKADPINS